MTDTPLLDEVRSAAAWVAGRARRVAIRSRRLSSFADELAAVPAFRLLLDPRYHYLGRGDDTVAFILCLDAINLGSGWFPWLVERDGLRGYFSLAAALKRRFEESGPLTVEDLAGIDAERCAQIFGQTEAPEPVTELMGHFARAWRELGRLLLARYAGDPAMLVAAAGASAERLVGILREMPSFDDVARYDGRRVPFFKRAQLTAVDLTLAFSGAGPGRFDDLDRLTIFADNQVPQVLRSVGVLEYAGDLAARIERGDEIAPGSPDEVEIRACAVHAVERLTAELATRGRPRVAWELDQLLWHRGLEQAAAAPAHRTRTRFY